MVLHMQHVLKFLFKMMKTKMMACCCVPALSYKNVSACINLHETHCDWALPSLAVISSGSSS